MINNKICLIIPYFGQLPTYFNFWLKSCENNPTIDWLLITDNALNKVPQNVHIINMTFNNLVSYIDNQFEFTVQIPTPYKLCDFKPAYGELFTAYLSNYEFWGHCDIDLIWGDLRKFINDDLLKNYDCFFRNGHLTIYRNTPIVNSWYRTFPSFNKINYEIVFSSPLNYSFDEGGGARGKWGGMNAMIKANKVKVFIKHYFDDVLYTQKSFYSQREVHNHPEFNQVVLSRSPTYFSYQNGKLYRHVIIDHVEYTSETMYVHLAKRKFKLKTQNTSDYIIIPDYICSNNLSKNKIKYACRHRIINFFYLKQRFFNLKKKIVNIHKYHKL